LQKSWISFVSWVRWAGSWRACESVSTMKALTSSPREASGEETTADSTM
jgi:hypothetical protein